MTTTPPPIQPNTGIAPEQPFVNAPVIEPIDTTPTTTPPLTTTLPPMQPNTGIAPEQPFVNAPVIEPIYD